MRRATLSNIQLRTLASHCLFIFRQVSIYYIISIEISDIHDPIRKLLNVMVLKRLCLAYVLEKYIICTRRTSFLQESQVENWGKKKVTGINKHKF